MFRRILVAIDGSGPASEHAVAIAADLASCAAPVPAAVALLHVVKPPKPYSPATVQAAIELEHVLVNQAKQMLACWRMRCAPELTVHEFVREGLPADEILAVARSWSADLIIVGDHNRRALARFLLGGTADAVVRRAPCPVLVARGTDAPAPASAVGIPEARQTSPTPC